LKDRYDFNLADAFCLLQPEGPDHLITEGAIQEIIRRNGEKITVDDELRIIRRVDKDGDGKIGY
jgi:hypothetical protein